MEWFPLTDRPKSRFFKRPAFNALSTRAQNALKWHQPEVTRDADWSDNTWKTYIHTVGMESFRAQSNVGRKTFQEIAAYANLAPDTMPVPNPPRKKWRLVPLEETAISQIETQLCALQPIIRNAEAVLQELYRQQRELRARIKRLKKTGSKKVSLQDN